MPDYIVTSPLHHDGESLAIGDLVKMDVKDAKPLLAKGVIAAAKAPTKPGAGDKPQDGEK